MYGYDPYENPHPGQQHARRRSPRPFDPDVTDDDRTWALLGHLSILAWAMGIPIILIVVLWAIKRKESPFLGDHLTESLNFQISLFIYSILLIPISVITCGLGGLVLIPILFLIALVGPIYACIAAHRAEYYRYPMCLRIVPG